MEIENKQKKSKKIKIKIKSIKTNRKLSNQTIKNIS